MVEKRVNKFGQGSPPPLFGQCPKENIFFYRMASLMSLFRVNQCSTNSWVNWIACLDNKQCRLIPI